MKTVTQRLIRYHKFEVVVLLATLGALAYKVFDGEYDSAIVLGGIAVGLFGCLNISYASRHNLDDAHTRLARARAYRETVERGFLPYKDEDRGL